MAVHWYALRCKPRKEDLVWQQIKARGHVCFYPRLRVNPVNPRAKKYKPYFPGYLFVELDLDEVGQSAFQWMPHTLGLVRFGGEPAYVPDNLIYALQRRVKEIAEAGGEVFDGLQKGDIVRIQAGPFEGYDAIFDARMPGKERVRVLLEFLDSHRAVPLELDASQIRQKN